MPRYKFRLTDEERTELEKMVQKGGKGYRVKHAQILLKLNDIPENEEWTHGALANLVRTAYAAPTFTTQPINQTVTAENDATFTAEATGNLPPDYQGCVRIGRRLTLGMGPILSFLFCFQDVKKPPFGRREDVCD